GDDAARREKRKRNGTEQIARAPPQQRVGILVASPGKQQQRAQNRGDEHRDHRERWDVEHSPSPEKSHFRKKRPGLTRPSGTQINAAGGLICPAPYPCWR